MLNWKVTILSEKPMFWKINWLTYKPIVFFCVFLFFRCMMFHAGKNQSCAVSYCTQYYNMASCNYFLSGKISQKKDKLIRLASAEDKPKPWQQYIFPFITISWVLSLIICGYFFRKGIINNRLILSQKKDLEQLNFAKDKLLSIISHDLRSSVNSLKTSHQRLFEQLEGNNHAQLYRMLQSNAAITNSIYGLLDNLLNWSLLQSKQLYFDLDAIHLLSIVQQVTCDYQPLMVEKGITFQRNIPADLYVLADLDSIKVIMRNLLDNAIKFSDDSSVIKVYATVRDSASCNLIVEDTGIGMKEEIRQQLLQGTFLFNKKKAPGKIAGTGLGLRLCQEMAKKNNASLQIESREHIGTKITIQWPTT